MLKNFFATTTVALLPLLSMPAIADDMKLARTLSLSGHGEVSVAPDIASLSLGVFTNGKTAAAALDGNSAAMAKVLAALKAAGVADKDLQTSNLMVNPRYDSRNDGALPVATGFDVSNTVTITVRHLTTVGKLLDQAVVAGANQVNGLSFGVANDQPVLDEARKRAVAEAKRRAEIYAGASGVRLGHIITIVEGGAYQPQPMVMAKAAMMERSNDVPIAQGEQVISIDVNITWEIK
jgi:uncharacterized protein